MTLLCACVGVIVCQADRLASVPVFAVLVSQSVNTLGRLVGRTAAGKVMTYVHVVTQALLALNTKHTRKHTQTHTRARNAYRCRLFDGLMQNL